MLDVSFLKTNIFSLNNVDAKKVLDSLEDDKLEADDRNESPRKRRRLDDFTPQERMIRRKLKNRVAAQSARDRKRERMDQLEKIVIRLESENKELKKSNEELRSGMHQLIAQNEELRMKLGLHDSKHNIKKISNTNECHIISTPVVPDHDHIVKSKQEGPDAEHAAEISGPPCFLNNYVVSKSKTGKLFDIIKPIKTGDCIKDNAVKKITIKTEQDTFEDQLVSPDFTSNEFVATYSNLSEKETNELFELCEDIQYLVGKCDDIVEPVTIENLNDSITSTETHLSDITDEDLSFPNDILDVLSNSTDLLVQSDFLEVLDSNQLNQPIADDHNYLSDDISDTISDSSSLFGEELSANLSTDPWDEIMSDLFPSLNSL